MNVLDHRGQSLLLTTLLEERASEAAVLRSIFQDYLTETFNILEDLCTLKDQRTCWEIRRGKEDGKEHLILCHVLLKEYERPDRNVCGLNKEAVQEICRFLDSDDRQTRWPLMCSGCEYKSKVAVYKGHAGLLEDPDWYKDDEGKTFLTIDDLDAEYGAPLCSYELLKNKSLRECLICEECLEGFMGGHGHMVMIRHELRTHLLEKTVKT